VKIDSVVTWKWSKPGYRSKFTAVHVNMMRRMVARHYPDPHRFICITDDPEGLDPEIEVVPLQAEWADVLNPTWGEKGPSCYRRLRAFSPEFEQVAGKRFVSIDLDVVITGDLRPLWNRDDEFVIFAAGSGVQLYNGSMFMMTTGSRCQVWDLFNPEKSPQLTHEAGLRGSDQAWIQYVLGPDEAVWTEADGVLSYKTHCLRKNQGNLPAGARMVMFWGLPDPWDPDITQKSAWVAEHYRYASADQRRLFGDLVLQHAGRTAVVMGGGPSLTEHLARCPKNALYLSCNEHGVMARHADYIVAMDTIDEKLRLFCRPVIGRRPFCDYRLPNWQDIGNTGPSAAWVAWALGARLILLAGMDCYVGGTYHHDPDAKSTSNLKTLETHLSEWEELKRRIPQANIRSLGGPTADIFIRWDPEEQFPEYQAPAQLLAMQGQPQYRVRTQYNARINGRRVEPKLELLVSENEHKDLLKNRTAVPVR
jgi:hypothetical protein